MASAVVARGLVKRFSTPGADGASLTAVDHIDLDVPTGVSFGVLGPNGAGKTTTMKMVSCVSPPSEGTLEVLGLDVGQHGRAIKARIGVVPQGMTLDTDLTATENLVMQGRYHGLSRRESADRARELLAFAQLDARGGSKPLQLSGGMQRRLLIARALVSDPDLVILDEPTTGLDPQARHLVWERLRSLRSRGTTLIITTHYMEEAARLCDRLVVMYAGRIIVDGTPAELIAEHVPPRVVEVQGAGAEEAAVRRAVGRQAREIERVGDRVVVYTDDSVAVVRGLRTAGLDRLGLLERDATLEDVFLRLTGHSLVD